MHLVSETLSLLLTPLNWKEFKGNLQLYVTLHFLMAYVTKYEEILVRLNFLTLHLRRRHLDALYLINIFRAKLVAHLFLILLVCAYPLGLSETTLLLLHIVISRSVPQLDVFLLPVQSVGALTSLTKIVFCLLMSVSVLNQNNFSLFLFPLFVFGCILLCFILFFILVLACN
jgi:hypothetical protein